MRKVVILTLVTLFTCVEYSQAQTTEKEMTRQEKKAAQEALDKMLFQEAKEAIDNQTFVLEADRVYFKYGTSAFVSSNTNFVGLDGDKMVTGGQMGLFWLLPKPDKQERSAYLTMLLFH